MIELFQFQREASATIAERFIEYLDDPVIVGTAKNPRQVPFYQALSSLTASGKRTLSARCPTHDPEPYARAWRRSHEAAVDQDRRRMQAIRWMTKGRAA